ncbi:MAG: leucyl/phenylalanyl-tRNA--protein transferase [Propionibacteriaceae bacterium]|jgi:leucyl/phenylalanyl-tRNA--protein transferase|nr:leucyl/phenylalanyl-tRNA--protein transferase [Propionibacteriaceae bacterium]
MPVLEVFGPPRLWPDEDLIAFSDAFDADLVLAAYRSGVFPMPLHRAFFGAKMAWWSPVRRGVLEPAALRVTRSLRQSAKRYAYTVDRDFARVIRRCADPARSGGWIDGDVIRVYEELFEAGHAHSVEAWTADGRLAGGLYGVALGGLFAGESMFHDPVCGRDASKAALVHLVRACLLGGGDVRPGRPERLVDVQWLTPHLASLGAVEISRQTYLGRLTAVIDQPAPPWPARAAASESAGGQSVRGRP